MDPVSRVVTSFFGHTRLDTTVVQDAETDTIIAFQRGMQYRLGVPRAKWMEKALGMKDVANSVLAPMPCKVLRVEVQAGDVVEKDQPLVVIESMKMETVIRSPQRGTIARVVHQQGVSHMVPFPFSLSLIPFFTTRSWKLVCFSSSGLDRIAAISQLGAAHMLGSRASYCGLFIDQRGSFYT
jgi:biotin carboxyl carrier protein